MRKIELLGPLMPERDARVSVEHSFADPAETPLAYRGVFPWRRQRTDDSAWHRGTVGTFGL